MHFLLFFSFFFIANVPTTDCPNPTQDWYCRDLVHTSSNPRVSCVAEAVITTEAVATTTESLATTEAVTTTTEAITTTEPVATTTEAVATTTEAVARQQKR